VTTSETLRTTASIRLGDGTTQHEFVAPGDADAAADAFVRVMGASPVRRVALDADLGAVAALALAVLMDETRRDALLALASGTECTQRGVVASQVAPSVDAVSVRPAGITSLVVGALGPTPVDCRGDAISDAFDELSSSGFVARESDRFVPDGAIRDLAPACLRVSASAQLVTPTLVRHAAQFGVQDLVVAQCNRDRVLLATTSAAAIATDAHALLTLAG
jgi:hypothetical protein